MKAIIRMKSPGMWLTPGGLEPRTKKLIVTRCASKSGSVSPYIEYKGSNKPGALPARANCLTRVRPHSAAEEVRL